VLGAEPHQFAVTHGEEKRGVVEDANICPALDTLDNLDPHPLATLPRIENQLHEITRPDALAVLPREDGKGGRVLLVPFLNVDDADCAAFNGVEGETKPQPDAVCPAGVRCAAEKTGMKERSSPAFGPGAIWRGRIHTPSRTAAFNSSGFRVSAQCRSNRCRLDFVNSIARFW